MLKSILEQTVRVDQIVLNISFEATNALVLGADWIEFSARFGGVAQKIEIPVKNVAAIYARETGQGIAFEAGQFYLLKPIEELEEVLPLLQEESEDEGSTKKAPSDTARSHIKRIK